MSEKLNTQDSGQDPSDLLFDFDRDTGAIELPVPKESRPKIMRKLGARAAEVVTRAHFRPAKTIEELLYEQRIAARSNTHGDASDRDEDSAYAQLGGGLYSSREVHRSGALERKQTGFADTLRTYQDWYTEFDRFAGAGVFEIDEMQREKMPDRERSAYHLHVFDVVDMASNRLRLIGREENPSVNPDITRLYGKRSDDELKAYAGNLTNLLDHARATAVVRAMYDHFDIRTDEYGAPQSPSWLMAAVREKAIQSKRLNPGRKLTLSSTGARFGALRAR